MLWVLGVTHWADSQSGWFQEAAPTADALCDRNIENLRRPITFLDDAVGW